jgi:D-galactarolactone cycloisomerase
MKMLGGAFRHAVTAYATGCYYPESFNDRPGVLRDLKAEAASYRDAIGPDVNMMVDANHAYSASTAIRMAGLMAPRDVCFFEEPAVPEDYDGYRRVRRASPIPVAGGECEFTRYGFRNLIGGCCVDIAQPDLAVCGGFTAVSQILTLANTYGVAVIPHVWGSGIALAAALHAIAIIPPMPHTANPLPLLNEPVVEFDRKHNPLRAGLLEEKFELVNGKLKVPDGPGLGVTVSESALGRFVGG